MKTIKLLIIAIPILVINSCKPGHLDGDASPCHEFRTGYWPLQDVYRQIFPYTGTETLRFLKNGIDTLTFEGKGTDSGYACYDYIYAPICPPDAHCYRYLKYTFSEKSSKDSLFVYTYQEGYIPGTTGTWQGVYNIRFKNIYAGLLTAIEDKRGIRFKDSTTINNTIFYNLSFIPVNNNFSDTTRFAYINRTNGIVMIKTINDEYTLIK